MYIFIVFNRFSEPIPPTALKAAEMKNPDQGFFVLLDN